MSFEYQIETFSLLAVFPKKFYFAWYLRSFTIGDFFYIQQLIENWNQHFSKDWLESNYGTNNTILGKTFNDFIKNISKSFKTLSYSTILSKLKLNKMNQSEVGFFIIESEWSYWSDLR